MMRPILSALLLAGCFATHEPDPNVFAGYGEPVPDAIVQTAVDELSACLGRPLSLDGWRVYYPADPFEDGRFACPQAQECGPKPPGCVRDEECPCRCAGLCDYDAKHIIVSADRKALRHELIHALLGIATHGGEAWSCQ
jgi:hypothetical protein